MSDTISWQASTTSSGTTGRALGHVRSNHFVVDDYAPPVGAGTGEQPGAAELFLSGVTACAVLMIERIARAEQLPLHYVEASIRAEKRLDVQRPGPQSFDSVQIVLGFGGVAEEEAARLTELFKDRCPLFGTISIATIDTAVTFELLEQQL